MDKRTISAFVLIGIVLAIWLVYTSINTHPNPKKTVQEKAKTEQIDTTTAKEPEKVIDSTSNIPKSDSLTNIDKFGEFFAPYTEGADDYITIENDLLKATISKKGASLIEW
jgi:YidC/Oxa1 family membrane protein insertase